MKVGIALLVSIFVFCFANLAYNLLNTHNTIHNCQQTELVKRRVRSRALEDYDHLADNARLLGIKLTPELKRAEKKALDRVLLDYAPTRCAGYFG